MAGADLLLVDDEPGILRALGRVLVDLDDLTVESVTDPREAAAILETRAPRVLLTDHLMPGMSGLELLREARRSAPDTIRILLTGRADRSHVIAAINAGGIFRFIEKPWDDDDLRSAVREALEAHEVRRAARALQRSAEFASGIQRGFLPCRPATGETSFLMTPHEYTSGDYVDVIALPGGRTALLMGDVCGHGLGAALFVATARALIRSGLAEGRDPAAVTERANRFLCRDMPDGRFLTLFLGIHDAEAGTLRYLNAGQPPPLVLIDGEVVRLRGTGLPLGLDAGVMYRSIEEIPLPAAATLLAYTDGLIEARDAAGTFYGEERVLCLLRDHGAEGELDALVATLRDDLHGFVGRGGVSDDLALLAYRPAAVTSKAAPLVLR